MYENCGKCLFKRHFQYKPNFFKIIEGVSSRDTFSIIPFFGNCEMWSLDTFHNFKNIGFILKVLIQKTLSTISIQIVENFEFMLKVSLEETPFTIPKKMELYLDVFHNF